jgi:hypothetical protein
MQIVRLFDSVPPAYFNFILEVACCIVNVLEHIPAQADVFRLGGTQSRFLKSPRRNDPAGRLDHDIRSALASPIVFKRMPIICRQRYSPYTRISISSAQGEPFVDSMTTRIRSVRIVRFKRCTFLRFRLYFTSCTTFQVPSTGTSMR